MNTSNTDNTPPVETPVAPAVEPVPVKAPAKRKPAAKVKAKGKAGKKVNASVKVKPAGDLYTGPYPQLKAWPKAAGAAPSRDHIIMARALGVGRVGTKRELAVASYLRDDALSYNTGTIAAALQAVVGGTYNTLLNVINRDVCGAMNLGKCIKAKVDGGTAYKLELNARGKTKVERYKLANGLVKAAGAVEPVPARVPAGDAENAQVTA
jgi:hypothetical protein